MSLLKVQNITKHFGGLTAVDDVSFSLDRKTIVGLIGPNGSGKTTLINLITGFYDFDDGNVFFKGQPIKGLKPYHIAEMGVGRTFQISRVFRNMSVLENLLVPMLATTRQELKLAREKAREKLEFLTIDHLRNEKANDLSYGQQRCVELGRVLMLNPDLILLDEPAAGVNPVLIEKILDQIKRLNKEGKAFLIIEHNVKVITKICHRVIVLNYGKKIADGIPQEIMRNNEVKEAYLG